MESDTVIQTITEGDLDIQPGEVICYTDDNDKIVDKYIIMHLIGAGSNAGIYMVYGIFTDKYYAMKVQAYDFEEDGRREIKIIEKINIYTKNNKIKQPRIITMLHQFAKSTDDEDDEEKTHICSVYDLYAGSLYNLVETGKYKYGLPIQSVKQITRQLLSSLDILHNKLNIIHTDIKLENILFNGISDYHKRLIDIMKKHKVKETCKFLLEKYSDDEDKFDEELDKVIITFINDFSDVPIYITSEKKAASESSDDSDDQLSDYIDTDDSNDDFEGEYESEVYTARENQSCEDTDEVLNEEYIYDLEDEEVQDGVLMYDFESVLNNKETTTDLASLYEDKYINDCNIVLIDFGSAREFAKRPQNKELQDRRFRAPEMILSIKNYGYAVDIWSIGCVVFQLLTGFDLFFPYDTPLNTDRHHLFLMEKNLGPMPDSMIKKSRRKRFLFDTDRRTKKRTYHIRGVDKINRIFLKDRLINQYLFSNNEAAEIADFLENIFVYEPEKRPTVQELMKHKWLK
jgi:serine/threonine protein kinase